MAADCCRNQDRIVRFPSRCLRCSCIWEVYRMGSDAKAEVGWRSRWIAYRHSLVGSAQPSQGRPFDLDRLLSDIDPGPAEEAEVYLSQGSLCGSAAARLDDQEAGWVSQRVATSRVVQFYFLLSRRATRWDPRHSRSSVRARDFGRKIFDQPSSCCRPVSEVEFSRGRAMP